MPMPANKANSLLRAMGIQTWVRRKNIHGDMQLLQLDLKIKQCAACSLHCDKAANVLGLGNADAEVLIIQDVFDDVVGSDKNAKEKALFNDLIHAINLQENKIYTTALLKCVPGRQDIKIEKQHIDACFMHLSALIQLIKPVVILSMGELAGGYFQKKGLSTNNGFIDFEGIPLLAMHSLKHLLSCPKDKKHAFKQLQQVKACLH